MGMEVAEMIFEQVGHKARFMMGAHTFVADGEAGSLTFRIKGSPAKVNGIKIEHEPTTDTYSMRFYQIKRVRGLPEWKEIAADSGVYVDAMHRVIESRTGLRTSL